MSAAKRPLSFQHVPTVPKRGLTTEQHKMLQNAEEVRMKRLTDKR